VRRQDLKPTTLRTATRGSQLAAAMMIQSTSKFLTMVVGDMILSAENLQIKIVGSKVSNYIMNNNRLNSAANDWVCRSAFSLTNF
jgi:hypothetical protein